MFALGNEIKNVISDVEGIADLNVEQQIERPQLKIVPKRDMLARYGITLPEFSRFVSVNMAGEVVSQVYEGMHIFDLTVKVGEEYRSQIEKIGELMIDASATGEKIPLLCGGYSLFDRSQYDKPGKREAKDRDCSQH